MRNHKFQVNGLVMLMRLRNCCNGSLKQASWEDRRLSSENGRSAEIRNDETLEWPLSGFGLGLLHGYRDHTE